MRYTVLLLPESEPDVFVAFVPVLDVTTQGETFEEALGAAREASILAVRGTLADDEDVPTEPRGVFIGSIDVPPPVDQDVT